MPELPEVQTVVSDLEKKIVGSTIVDVWFDHAKMIKDPLHQSRRHVSQKAVRSFVEGILGKKILRVERIAKNIVIHLSGDFVLLIHQKMTGHILIGNWSVSKRGVVTPISPRAVVEDSYNHYIHLLLTLDDRRMVGLSDVRKFAKILFGPREVIMGLPEITQLGPDALSPDLTSKEFYTIINSHSRHIKTVLLDPKVVAGIGNIYSDDILWKAKIHPMRRANTLTKAEVNRIYKYMREILARAVRLRGTSTTDFRDTDGLRGGYTNERLVYQRDGEPCARCKTPIIRIVVGGRGARICTKCQLKP